MCLFLSWFRRHVCRLDYAADVQLLYVISRSLSLPLRFLHSLAKFFSSENQQKKKRSSLYDIFCRTDCCLLLFICISDLIRSSFVFFLCGSFIYCFFVFYFDFSSQNTSLALFDRLGNNNNTFSFTAMSYGVFSIVGKLIFKCAIYCETRNGFTHSKLLATQDAS